MHKNIDFGQLVTALTAQERAHVTEIEKHHQKVNKAAIAVAFNLVA